MEPEYKLHHLQVILFRYVTRQILLSYIWGQIGLKCPKMSSATGIYGYLVIEQYFVLRKTCITNNMRTLAYVLRQINRTDQNYPEGWNKFFKRILRFSSFAVELLFSYYFQNGEKGVNPEEKSTSPSDALNATHGAVESSDSSSLVD